MIIVSQYDERREIRESDLGKKLRQIETGAIYDKPIDLIPCQFTYEETDEPADDDVSDVEALSILLGGAV